MKFIADLHVHSKYSRATARNLDFENLHIAAQIKGITVVGTGDAVHPGWLAEIEEKLVPAEPGLFRLRDDLAAACEGAVPDRCRRPVRFMLQTEISNIYKKDGRTRKNHNLVYLPDLDAAKRLQKRLERVGNIASDGRPILGLDARDLLEIVLEVDPAGFLVPAHVWTPWFSLLGSKSGFDGIEECFGDLVDRIFAVETGLSSDPAMNWRVSGLDGVTLISNSDAHSPFKLGREANRFDTDLSYAAIRLAMEKGDPHGFVETLEFYPEEGKYHLDGHRKCDVRMHPEESLVHSDRCPVCGKEMTLGVLHRVVELADQADGRRPAGAHPYTNIVPLTDILADTLRVGAGSKAVQTAYQRATETLGDEFSILCDLPIETLAGAGIPLLAPAIERMRTNRITVNGGYDGVFGTIRIFSDTERDALLGQKRLFSMPAEPALRPGRPVATPAKVPPAAKSSIGKPVKNPGDAQSVTSDPILSGLNPEQHAAVTRGDGPTLVVAGPGSGKTLTLTRRIAWLIREKSVNPDRILAVTFTNKAAGEMRERLERLLPDGSPLPMVTTFHGFCLALLADDQAVDFRIIDDVEQHELVRLAKDLAITEGTSVSMTPAALRDRIGLAKQQIVGPEAEAALPVLAEERLPVAAVYQKYQDLLELQGLLDFEDLIFRIVRRMEEDPSSEKALQERFPHVFIDEYQDLNHGQYRLVRALSPPDGNLFAIGDPDQSIYGFRGSDRKYFQMFRDDYPGSETIRLKTNYRSTGTIVDAAYQVIGKNGDRDAEVRVYSEIDGVRTITVLRAETEKAEAVAIGKAIEAMVGGSGFQSIDFGVVEGTDTDENRSFSDFAVLYRTHDQGRILAEALTAGGIPVQMASRPSRIGSGPVRSFLALLNLSTGGGNISDLIHVADCLEPRIRRDTAEKLRLWAFQHRLPYSGLRFHVRQYPLPDMAPALQQRLYEFLGALFQLESAVKGLSPTEALAYLQKHTRLKAMIAENDEVRENVVWLTALAEETGGTSRDFLAAVGLQSDTDLHDPRAERVSLMTLHAAKGLEFSVVFIAGCEDGLIPFQPPGREPADPEEERRLFFVALTRAREKLYLCRARRRRIYGVTRESAESPFVNDIAARLRDHRAPERRNDAVEKTQQQLSLF